MKTFAPNGVGAGLASIILVHMQSSLWVDIETGIEPYFAKRYIDNKYNLKRDNWNVFDGQTHDVDAIRRQPPPNEEMTKLRDLGANTPTGVPYTEKEIFSKVRKGKEWGYISRRDMQVASLGKTKLAKAKVEAKANRRELDELRNALKTNSQMVELLSQLGSCSEMGLGRGTKDRSGEGESGGVGMMTRGIRIWILQLLRTGS
ncbi:hypothetical protein Tco_1119603 [Tanacetum coccineum]